MGGFIQLEQLYDEHADALFSFLLNLTRHEADTRDALQEIFRRLALRPELLEGVRDARGFLLRMAHNQAIDAIRHRAARDRKHESQALASVGLFASTPDPDTQTFRTALESALSELPPEQRAVVHLKLWEGLTFERIAEILAIPLNTAASRYRYGLDKLRDLLRPIYAEIKS